MTEVKCWNGGEVATLDVEAATLGEVVKRRLLRDAVIMYEANRRQGTAQAKTRSETAYTGAKPYRQKGTGRARRGDRNSPLMRGGGVTFGPRPRDYRYALPRKALREALRSALLGKLRDNEVAGLQSGPFTKPSTKTAAAALRTLECTGSALVVLPGDHETLYKSFRNLPRVDVLRASDVNAYHVLSHRQLLVVDDAWDVLLRRLDRGDKGSS